MVVCTVSVSVLWEQSLTENMYQPSLAFFYIILDYSLDISL